MSHPLSHRLPLPRILLCALVPLALAGCGRGADDDASLAVDEASAYLQASQETGDIGADAVVAADDTSVGALADEDVAMSTGDATDDGSPCDFQARRQQVLAKYDANGDGHLDRAELRALRADLVEDGLRPRRWALGTRARAWAFWRVRWAFDEDGSHSLDAEERASLVDAMEARCERLHAQRLEHFDANHDGQLDDAERAAAREAARQRWAELRAALLAKYDANGNGQLDDAERAQLRADRVAAAQARRAQLVAQYDTDGDGRLSVAEALPLRKALQQRIIEGKDAERDGTPSAP
ncbi:MULTISPECIES: calcium-binding protein [Myxococcaceae]|uniref:calcium-binding protein n=1 Tax=Myxococcaceae TaxID=31 RepID=UPI00188F985B|nr:MULTISPECIES: calcium-binding protein [Myxococcaceae]MBF5041734.1 calcium-binding protein [Simulacricoccus sp. 17bor-14]